MKRWRCILCGHIHDGPKPPFRCPVCGAPRRMFEEVSC
ncbi:rubredoxin-like domain-containing protein [Desulfonema ishimotonii]|nr:rubrerythrin family protein [Desulfonema ishimotonii]